MLLRILLEINIVKDSADFPDICLFPISTLLCRPLSHASHRQSMTDMKGLLVICSQKLNGLFSCQLCVHVRLLLASLKINHTPGTSVSRLLRAGVFSAVLLPSCLRKPAVQLSGLLYFPFRFRIFSVPDVPVNFMEPEKLLSRPECLSSFLNLAAGS